MTKRVAGPRRHVPQRTCVACRCTTVKRELIRIVRTPEGSVEVDPTGKRSGRGAYLCSRVECWQEALRKDRLSSALRTKLSEKDRERLRAHAESLTAASAV
jgi:predicted RNA-binding protein YlxR (DUF448 family)